MTPDETIILRADIDTDTNEWYESIMSATMVARANKLGRSVTIDEFFGKKLYILYQITLIIYRKCMGYNGYKISKIEKTTITCRKYRRFMCKKSNVNW